MTVDRRRFLASGAAAVLTGCASDRPTTPTASVTSAVTTPRPDPAAAGRVVVVGGGLAGLTAALVLRRSGWDVVVLEARTRLGGRVHTLAVDGDDLIAEGGGESIDDGHDRLQWWVSELGLRTHPRLDDRDPTALIATGDRRRTGAAALTEDDGAVGADYGRASTALDDLVGDSDPADLSSWSNAEQLDGRSAASFLDALALHPTARFLVESSWRSAYNCELADLSLLLLAQQEALTPTEGEETMRIEGGNSRVVDAMASRLRAAGASIRTGAVVRGVRRVDGVSAVDVEGGPPTWCRHVVLAVPPPPLRRVTFEPALPASIAAAIAGLDLGTTVKVATRYDRRPWAAEGYSGLTVSDLDFRIAWDATDGLAADGAPPPADGPAVLTTFTSGSAGAMLGALAPDARIELVGTQLDRTYPGGADARSRRAATIDWAAEEYTGGGYAFWRPGRTLAMSTVWRESFDGVWFAGEHTEVLVGYMESAVRSGERVAAAIGTR